MGGSCSAHGEMRNAYKTLVVKRKRKRPLERLDGRITLRWIEGKLG
jgi:hypothetical protein